MEGVRKANKKLLAENVLRALNEMAGHGTTTVEAKSGYGLTLESELKSLEAIREAANHWPGTVVATLLGAHVVPKEFRNHAGKYVELVCNEMIPRVAKRKLAKFVDVFTRAGSVYFEETKRFLQRLKAMTWSTGPCVPVEQDCFAIAVTFRSRLIRPYGLCIG